VIGLVALTDPTTNASCALRGHDPVSCRGGFPFVFNVLSDHDGRGTVLAEDLDLPVDWHLGRVVGPKKREAIQRIAARDAVAAAAKQR
jgi:hypothetical protein